ncbi:MAG TPA: site-specific integrase [Candidatus Korarchaeota archaeon]|nr:site-specific integrase [Candidatus Korarchaeota archaeon]
MGTLVKLKYKHVKEDLEAGRVPVHIHVEAEITKGKYCDYDTFINEEAAHYLKLYLEQRRKGTRRIPPEEIKDESPLFRTYEREVRPISPKTAEWVLRETMRRAGLSMKKGKRCEVRVHSLRKFFRTQMAALGVPSDYIEYMMGHKLSTYHDVRMKGIEFLRSVYAAANLRIFQKEKVTLADILKEIIKSRGEDPSKYLKEHIMAGKAILSEEEEAEVYARAIWEMLKRDQMASLIGSQCQRTT